MFAPVVFIVRSPGLETVKVAYTAPLYANLSCSVVLLTSSLAVGVGMLLPIPILPAPPPGLR